MPDHILVHNLRIIVGMLHHVRPGTHQTHLPFEHIDELRELVQTGLAQDATDTGHPHVIFGGLLGIGILVGLHAPEFETVERLIVLARALLREEYGAPGFQPDQQADQRNHPG